MQLDLDQVGLGLLGEETKKDEIMISSSPIPSSDSPSTTPPPPSNNNYNSSDNKMNGYTHTHNKTSENSTTTKTLESNGVKHNGTPTITSTHISHSTSTENSVQRRIVTDASKNSSSETVSDPAELLPKEIKANGGVVDGYLTRDEDVHDLEGPTGPLKIVWRNVIIFLYLHMAIAYAAYLMLTGQVMWQTIIFSVFLHFLGGMGITAGAHRCWSHKAYKARTPLKLLLTFMQTLAFQNSIWEWVRDHRVHHKYAETNADPHNAKRGFFFAHIGWLLCRKHDLVRVKGKQLDMSDIESDPILAFQKKYHLPLGLLLSFVMPTVVPHQLWGESLFNGFLVGGLFRYAFTLHMTWLVNSAAHMWGSKPYDQSINPSENKSVAFWAFGEGWHNYHHVFPWDYKTAELGHYRYNFTTAFVDFFAAIGWAYDLKTVKKSVVVQRVQRTGDGSWSNHDAHSHENAVWGWGDKDIPAEDAKATITLSKRE